ncbi:MAG TPA: aldehyde ferredoxin oxidoreductase C-terminal domain-containing protein [Dongiaceae bacterium]|nr:aldehyde ferredoxin oxidoreductase C-terminal domain-containing protein [Dongiaceae bacterium]
MALRVLRIMLDTHQTQSEELPAIVEQEYLGGRGAATWMLANRLPPDTGPLSPSNLLIFSAGPLAGTGIAATGGFVASTRSTITGTIAHSWGQGRWGGALRRAGYDLLVLEGQAEEWCYLQIDRGQTHVRSARRLIGLDTLATTQMIREALGDEYAVLCIGPAGEAGVAYSAIVSEGTFMAEPAGAGAVMARKQIKAIAIRGDAEIALIDADRVTAVIDGIGRRIAGSELAAGIRQYGSLFYAAYANKWGALTGRNGQDGRIPHFEAISHTRLAQRGRRETRGCENCPLPCHSVYIRRSGSPLAYPELEALAGFGGRCGITSPDALLVANDLCLRLGLDVAAASAAIAFMMECQQQGLSSAGTLPWGDDDALLAALERLGQRHEKRDVLSLGVGEMKEIFFGSETFAPQVKGLAMPALDPRALHEVALAIATAPIGGDYRYAMAYEEMLAEPPPWLPDEPSHPQAIKGKALRLIWHERFAAALDAAGLCRRLALLAYQITPAELTELLSAAIGRPWTAGDLARMGERIVTVERLFAHRYGTHAMTDMLPSRWCEFPLADGRAAGHLPELDDMLAEYYRRHGWDEQGSPTPERLAELGIPTE